MIRLASLLVIVAVMAAPQESAAGQVAFADVGIQAHVRSLKELRESRVVMQEKDFSCGSAAVATLLSYSYDEPTNEEDSFKAMYAVGDQESIRVNGFSMLDMVKYLESIGHKAEGYELTLQQFVELQAPAITLIHPNGYNHFVVVRGWGLDGVIVADPRLGLRRMPLDEFNDVWNGIVLVLTDKEHISFDDAKDVALLPTPLGKNAMLYANAGTSNFYLNLPTINDF